MNKNIISDFYMNNASLLIKNEKYLSPKIKPLKDRIKNRKKYYNFSNNKLKIINLKINSPHFFIKNNTISKFYQKNKESPNIKLNLKSLNNDLKYSRNKGENNKINNDLKKLKKSNSIVDNINRKPNYYFNFENKKNTFLNYRYEYEYNKFLFFKKKRYKNKIKENTHYINEIKDKYFIRGLALNKELAFYYNECRKVDFSENDNKNNDNNNIYDNLKSFNKKRLNFINSKNEFNNKRKNNIFINKRLKTNYSLKNLVNNKIPVTILI